MSPAGAEPRAGRRGPTPRTWVGLSSLLALVVLLTLLEFRIIHPGLELPVSNTILVFALININSLLLLLLILLVVRNLMGLLLERRAKEAGARLKTKLVAAFMTLALAPAGVLFFLTVQFIGASLGYWFDIQLDRPLSDALEVGRHYYRTVTGEAEGLGRRLGLEATRDRLLGPESRPRLLELMEQRRSEHGLGFIRIVSAQGEELGRASEPELDHPPGGEKEVDLIKRALARGRVESELVQGQAGDWVLAAIPLAGGREEDRRAAALVTGRRVGQAVSEKLASITQGYRDYHHLQILKDLIRTSHYLTLSLAGLLLVFGAVWFGFRLARSITGPLQELVEGTERIAAGDYDFKIETRTKDEVGTLVRSFNRMTRDLKSSKEGLERANRELRATNQENERRRRYMEIVLASVAAGVISIDQGGTITTINPPAEMILGLEAEKVIGRSYLEVMEPDQAALVTDLARAAAASPSGRIEKHARLPLAGRTVSLLLRASQFKEGTRTGPGTVVVIEDLTELEKAQRMAAWREVARRIAHEIKNPLTPIKLSAQRLQKRFALQVEEKAVFDQALETITQQVDALRSLVDEFSSFARMPSAELQKTDLADLLAGSLALYREAHREVAFDLVTRTAPPPFYFDPDQIKRVLINLLDNAVAAIEDGTPGPEPGRVMIRLHHLDHLQLVRIEVADNGPGLEGKARERLFEPHFSTKRQGTGLGLAIVRTIIQDHGGYIRVQDNAPRGTKFVIELPTGGWTSELEVNGHVPDRPGG